MQALAEFTGVGRRFSRHGDLPIPSGGRFTLIDDYGHHPVEMAATLEAARGAFPGRRIVLAFQPHRYTRTRDCFEDFVKVLSTCDALLLAEVYPAGEAPIVAADGRSLARAIRVAGKVEPVFVESIDEMPGALMDVVRDGDVVIGDGRGVDRPAAGPAHGRRGGMSVDATALGKVGVLFGGRSSEREVSIMSGTGVLKALQSPGRRCARLRPGHADARGTRGGPVRSRVHRAARTRRRGRDDPGRAGDAGRAVHRQRRAGLGDRDRQARDQASVAAGRHSDAALPGARERRPGGAELRRSTTSACR